VLIFAGINRDLITATAAIAGIGSLMFGFLTNLPVALAYGFPPCDLLISHANSPQPWHGSQCVFHVPSCWVPWNRPCLLQISSHGCLCGRLHFRFPFFSWHAPMACQSDTGFHKGCERGWYWVVSHRDWDVIFRWHRLDHRKQCYSNRHRRMSSSISGSW